MSVHTLTTTEQAILSRIAVVGPLAAREIAYSLDLSTRLVLAYLWQLRRHGWVTEVAGCWRMGKRRP